MTKSLAFHGVTSSTFSNYLNENPSAESEYIRAQAIISESLVEEIIEIADNDNDPQRARNRIDARKWYAGKTKPQKFGDRIDLNITQVVDIGSALAEARSRVVGEIPQVKQVIDTLSQSSNQATGYEPVDIEHAPKKSSDDIYD